MKITDIRLRRMKTIESIGEIDPAWPGPIMTFRRGGGAFTEIEIDDGLVGIGPAVDPDTVTAAKNISFSCRKAQRKIRAICTRKSVWRYSWV